MPAVRLSRRRKSSHILFSPAKPGIYGISQRPVTFAPNVTPVSFVDSEDASADLSLDADTESGSPTSALFPPSVHPAPPPTRKRCPPGKRRSQGYIPRPPNAFMLFRADFVRQKHVPGSIETNHGSLSKIIGNCWRQLPLDEKRVWEVRAKQEKANHKAQFPDYRFRPVHNKNKGLANTQSADPDAKRKEKAPTTMEDERRCEEVAQLLLEGKKGEELAQAVRHLDRERERELEMESLGLDMTNSRPPSSTSSASSAPLHLAPSGSLHMPMPMMGMGVQMHMPAPQMPGMHAGYGMRRPSSVPLPSEFYNYGGAGGIAMPALPFFAQSQSRPISPVASISRQGHHQHHPSYLTAPYASQQQSFSFAPFQSHTEFSFNSHDPFAQQHQQQEHHDVVVDPAFAFSNPFAPHQTLLPLSLQPTPTQSTFTASSFGTGFGHPSLAQRNSLGLGRRASSAQAMLMRNYTMPMYTQHHAEHQQQPLERDHSPLPDVEPELFAPDFSFGGSSSSSSSVSGVGMADGGAVSPVHTPTEVDPVCGVPPPSMGSSNASTAYDGSPEPALDAAAYMHHAHQHHQQLEHQQHQHELDGMYTASGEMYAVSVDDGTSALYAPHMPLEALHHHEHVHPEQMWGGAMGKGMEMGMELGMGMETYFEAGAF